MLISLAHWIARGRYRLAGFHSSVAEHRGCAVQSVSNREEDNPSLLFLHGLGTLSSSWINILPAFRQRFRVVAPDLPGFGFSTLPPATPFLSLAEHVEVLEEWVDRTFSNPFTLIGHSLGGWIAMRLAARIPTKIRKLVLINPAGVYYEGVESVADTLDVHSTAATLRLLRAMWYRYPKYLRPFTGFVYRDLRRRSVPAFVRSLKRNDFAEGALQALRTPVALIWGRKDRLLSSRTIDILRKEVPTASVSFIEQCGHVPQLERPRELIRILEKIL